jgi:hypothetical protein
MADEGSARPVSGEIMTDAPLDISAAAVMRVVGGGDVVDAEFEIVRGPGQGPDMAEPTLIATAAAPTAGMDMLRRPAERQTTPSRAGPLFWGAGLGIACAAFWVSGGHAIVRAAPFLSETASEPLRALRISGVTSLVDASGIRPLLFVDGEAANDGTGIETLPPLAIIVTDNAGVVIRYKLGTGGRHLAAGERFAFSSRLDVPKNGVKTVKVTFGE